MIRKVLTATINYDHPQTGMGHAFRGIFGDDKVVDFDYLELRRSGYTDGDINQEFLNLCHDFKPDWIWLQVQETGVLSPDTLRMVKGMEFKPIITHWTGDMRRNVSPYLAEICKVTHATFASSIGQLKQFTEAGAPWVDYVQIGLDWHEDVLGLPDWTPPFKVPDVVFCGTNYGDTFPGTAQRIGAIKALQREGFDVGVVGSGWNVDEINVVGRCEVKQQHHVWKRAKVGLNVNNFNDVDGYYSDRQLISMASGTPIVCHYIPGLEREFKNGIHCGWYKSIPECLAMVRELLDKPDKRLAIGRAGRTEVMRNHTWFNRILKLIPDIGYLRSLWEHEKHTRNL